MTRILIFSPYALWGFHSLYDGTIAKASRVRGASVEYVLCDGLLPECDQHWDSKANSPRPYDICQRCTAAAKQNLVQLEFPHRWLGEFVSAQEKTAAFAWAQSVPAAGMRQACYQGMPFGEWVLSSMNSFFRQYPPDLTSWNVVSVYRGFLYSAALVAIGLGNYLKANAVDAALLFNGRQSITRVALEIFQRSGIRVLTHERAEYQPGRVNVRANAHCMNPEPFRAFWKMWGDVPLDRDSLNAVLRWLIQRRYGANLAWIAYNKPSAGPSALRTKLKLTNGKRFWVLFTSSSDEVAGDPLMQGPYDSQADWVRDVVQWVSSRSDVELVIKVHPNLGGNSYIGKATEELKIYDELRSNNPANVRFVFPEDSISAYALAEEADLGLTFGSTIGLEMAMLGKPICLASRAIYEQCSSLFVLKSRNNLSELLERCLHAPPSREIQRESFRLAYCYIFRFELPFPAIEVSDLYDGKLIYQYPADFAPGKDESLDRICGFLVDGKPLFDAPKVEELSRTSADETRFFAALERAPGYLVDPRYERWLKLRSLGRSVKETIQHMPLGNGLLKITGGKWQAWLKHMETRESERSR